MALTKRLNYYIDSNGKYRRIPWDTWYEDGTFIGISPAPMGPTVGITFTAAGVVTLIDDFMDEGEGEDITGMILWDDEDTFLDQYDDVCYFYESDCCQTYETDYHLTARQS